MKVDEEKEPPSLIATASYLVLAVNSCSAILVLNWWDNKQFIDTYHVFSTSCMQCTLLVTNIILKAFFTLVTMRGAVKFIFIGKRKIDHNKLQTHQGVYL